MEEGRSSAPTGAVLVAVGGVVLALGSVMTWAKASIDLNAFASALGIDPAQIPASAASQTSKTFAGTSSNDGKIVLACGIVAIVFALGAFAKRELSKPFGVLGIIAGLVGGGVALYDIGKKGDVIKDAKAAAGPSLAALGIDTSILDTIFKVSLGIGIWLCVLGGVVAIVGGLMLMMTKSAAMPMVAGAPAGVGPSGDMGFGTGGAPVPPPPGAPAPVADTAPEPPAPAAPPASETGDGEGGPSSS